MGSSQGLSLPADADRAEGAGAAVCGDRSWLPSLVQLARAIRFDIFCPDAPKAWQPGSLVPHRITADVLFLPPFTSHMPDHRLQLQGMVADIRVSLFGDDIFVARRHCVAPFPHP